MTCIYSLFKLNLKLKNIFKFSGGRKCEKDRCHYFLRNFSGTFSDFFSKGGYIPCTSYSAFNFRCNNGTAYWCFQGQNFKYMQLFNRPFMQFHFRNIQFNRRKYSYRCSFFYGNRFFCFGFYS